jgi:hypothetical protein
LIGLPMVSFDPSQQSLRAALRADLHQP